MKKGHRGRGLAAQLLRAAVEYVGKQGGEVVEGYPVEPRKDHVPTGFSSTVQKVGFIECLRRSETRPITRYYVETGGDAGHSRGTR